MLCCPSKSFKLIESPFSVFLNWIFIQHLTHPGFGDCVPWIPFSLNKNIILKMAISCLLTQLGFLCSLQILGNLSPYKYLPKIGLGTSLGWLRGKMKRNRHVPATCVVLPCRCSQLFSSEIAAKSRNTESQPWVERCRWVWPSVTEMKECAT